jgi:putative hemolysin
MSPDILINLGLFVFLLFLSGFFSSSETAFTSLSTAQIQTMAKKKGARGLLVSKMTQRPAKLITAILIGNNLVNVWATVIAGNVTDLIIQSLGFSAEAGFASGIVVAAVTILVLIFGEVVPKQYAINHNEGLALATAPIIWFLTFLFRPFIWVLTGISNLAIRIFGQKKRAPVTLEGLVQLVNLAKSLGLLRHDEQQILQNTFRFKDVTVKQILTHRTEVFSLSEEEPLIKVKEQILKEGFSRIPLFDPEDPEVITGVLLMQDALKQWHDTPEDLVLRHLMTKPLYIPSSKKAKDLLEEFKKATVNIAIVLDEYGGLAGIVTREDVIEEIMGELYDEDEEQEAQKITFIVHGRYTIAGDTPIHAVNDELGLSLNPEDAQSFAGYIVEQSGHIPRVREKIKLPIGTVIIRKMDKLQIEWVELSLPEKGKA